MCILSKHLLVRNSIGCDSDWTLATHSPSMKSSPQNMEGARREPAIGPGEGPDLFANIWFKLRTHWYLPSKNRQNLSDSFMVPFLAMDENIYICIECMIVILYIYYIYIHYIYAYIYTIYVYIYIYTYIIRSFGRHGFLLQGMSRRNWLAIKNRFFGYPWLSRDDHGDLLPWTFHRRFFGVYTL